MKINNNEHESSICNATNNISILRLKIISNIKTSSYCKKKRIKLLLECVKNIFKNKL